MAANAIIFKIFFILLIAFLLLYFFYFDRFYPRYFRKKKWFLFFIQQLKRNNFIRIKLLFLSVLRNIIFSFQFVVVLWSFGLEFSFTIFLLVWNVFFWSTLIPSLWFGKLLIRESVALWVFTSFGFPGEIVLVSSLVLWIINHGISALISVPFFKLTKRNA